MKYRWQLPLLMALIFALVMLSAIIGFQLALASAASRPRPALVGNATYFGTPGDKWAGGPVACATSDGAGNRVHRTVDWHRKHGTIGITHRSLPCLARIRVTMQATGRSVIAVVIDRGPYGACTYPGWRPRDRRCPKGYWRVKKKRTEPGVWRSVVDLLPATAERLGHRGGLQPVRLEVISQRI